MLGIPKLDDANNAGTRKSGETTLIITEGDSAKALAVGGLGVVGRDNYGVFPLKVWNDDDDDNNDDDDLIMTNIGIGKSVECERLE